MAALAATLAVATAEAGTRRSDRDDAEHRALADGFPATIALVLDSGRCSATVIDLYWALTAAHCLDPASVATLRIGGASHVAIDWFIHPDWDGNLAAGADLALLEFDHALHDVLPATRGDAGGIELVGLTGHAVGFGRTGTGATGDTVAVLAKRAGTNAIDHAGAAAPGGSLEDLRDERATLLVFDPTRFAAEVVFADFDEPGAPASSKSGSPLPLDLEYLIAGGDSGGGLYVDGALVAVHSFVLATDGDPNSGYGDLMGATAVAPHAEWIETTIPEAQGPAAGLAVLAALAACAQRRRAARLRAACAPRGAG